MTKTAAFYACSLVCRSWLHRSRLHLYKRVDLWGDRISNFQTTLRKNPSISSTRRIRVSCMSNPISALFTLARLRNLEHLELHSPDLTKEHPLITRGLLSRSVTRLELWNLERCTVSCLLRFLNSFVSLTTLVVGFNSEELEHKGQILPHPRPIPSRFLTNLNISVVRGLERLIEWYIREGYYLSNIKKLELEWRFVAPFPEDHSCPDGPMSLLDHCADTLEHLTLQLLTVLDEDPVANESPYASMS